MSLQNLKNQFPKQQLSLILNIVLAGILLAVLILRIGQPERREFDEDQAEAAAESAVSEHEHDNEAVEVEGRVLMTDRQIDLNGIEVLKAGPARIQTRLTLIGGIHVNADRNVQVVSRLPGIVESVSVNAGDTVSRGELLAVISSQAIADQRSSVHDAI